MRAIAKFAMRSPTAASISAAAYAIFALFFAPFVVVSGAIIGLATLRFGAARSVHVFGGSLLIAGGAYYALIRQPAAVFILGATWVPTVVAAQVLRQSERQGLALTVCAIFAALYAVAVRLLVPDVSASWMARLQAVGETVRSQGGTFFSADEISVVAGIMHEATIVVACLYWMTAVLLARWWQSELYNPTGFGAEFRKLVLPRSVSAVAAVIAVLALVQLLSGARGVASDLLVVLVVLFAFQGLALVHHRAKLVGLARWWLVGFYVLLVMMPHRVGIVLAFVGIADTLIDVRKLRGVNGAAN